MRRFGEQGILYRKQEGILRTIWPRLVTAVIAVTASGQSQVDYVRDIQPIFRQNCYGCHGPSQQMAGFRIDRRSSAFKTGLRRIVPGSVENSIVAHRIEGPSMFGPQMPPTGPLKPAQIEQIKSWIAQGAVWPDALANETDRPAADAKATAAIEQLRSGDRAGFWKAVHADPKLLNARGPDGVTPFLNAVLYGDASIMEELLKLGADANARDDANATALMWAVRDAAKTRALLDHKADVNAMSDNGYTALTIAAGYPGRSGVVKMLLDRGANPNPTKIPAAQATPLTQAAVAGDVDMMALLLARGAQPREDAGNALDMAVALRCPRRVDLLLARRYLLEHGADPNAVDPMRRTALMFAAVSVRQPICSDYIGQTATVLRALQLYTPKAGGAEYDNAIRLAGNWLAHVAPTDNEDRFWRLQGLSWYGKDKPAMATALKDVLAVQKADGGWSALPTTESNAYSTGRALVALRSAGVAVSEPRMNEACITCWRTRWPMARGG